MGAYAGTATVHTVQTRRRRIDAGKHARKNLSPDLSFSLTRDSLTAYRRRPEETLLHTLTPFLPPTCGTSYAHTPAHRPDAAPTTAPPRRAPTCHQFQFTHAKQFTKKAAAALRAVIPSGCGPLCASRRG